MSERRAEYICIGVIGRYLIGRVLLTLGYGWVCCLCFIIVLSGQSAVGKISAQIMLFLWKSIVTLSAAVTME